MIFLNPLTLPGGQNPQPHMEPILDLPKTLTTLEWELTHDQRTMMYTITAIRRDRTVITIKAAHDPTRPVTLYYAPTHETFTIEDPNDWTGPISWIKADLKTRSDVAPFDAPPVIRNIIKIIQSAHPRTEDTELWKYQPNGPVIQLLAQIQEQPPITIVASVAKEATTLYVSVTNPKTQANEAKERITIRNDDPTALLGWISITTQYLKGKTPPTPTTPPTFYKVNTRRISLVHAPTDEPRRLHGGTIVSWNPNTLTLTPLEARAEKGLKISHYLEKEAITVTEAKDFLQYTKGTDPPFIPTDKPDALIQPMTFQEPKNTTPLYPLGSP